MSAPPAAHAVIAATLEERRADPNAPAHVIHALDLAGYDIQARPPQPFAADRPPVPTGPVTPRPLTAGQRETLLLIAADLSNAEIAQRLWLTETAVKSRVKALFVALGVGTRLDAVLTSMELGHVSLGDVLVARAELHAPASRRLAARSEPT